MGEPFRLRAVESAEEGDYSGGFEQSFVSRFVQIVVNRAEILIVKPRRVNDAFKFLLPFDNFASHHRQSRIPFRNVLNVI